jgi:cytochrome c553
VALVVTVAVHAGDVEVKKNSSNAKRPKLELEIKGDPVAGKAKLEAERCLECHDQQGSELSQGAINKFATLSGQQADYIIKQVHDFREGKRRYDFMAMMAKSLTEQDLVDIAAYFGSQPKMQNDKGGENSRASLLYNAGDATRNIAACTSCHGKNGEGQKSGNIIYPAIAGQQWNYLDQQLRNWRSGERNNSVGNVMNNAAKLLTDEEIDLLSHYISGL